MAHTTCMWARILLLLGCLVNNPLYYYQTPLLTQRSIMLSDIPVIRTFLLLIIGVRVVEQVDVDHGVVKGFKVS
jgi:hypothetical protein